MKKHSIDCPLCGRSFDPRAPYPHIQEYHALASDAELALLRDARRRCFGKSKPLKKKSYLLSLNLYVSS